MDRNKKNIIYKTAVSLLFGVLGFLTNFHTLIFQLGDYTVAVLFGLIFPLLITLSWGWKYGLVSALFGGCQTMWWLWGPSNGYAVFLVVPPFTLWIAWHGIWSEIRRRRGVSTGLHHLFLVEIPFRLLNSLNILTITRLAIHSNPPPWDWAAAAAVSIPMSFSLFIVLKQAGVALVLLLLADLLLTFNPVRAFFKLEPLADQKRTGYLVSFSLIMGCMFWLLDSAFFAFFKPEGRTFIDYFVRDIPDTNLFTRTVFLLFCLTFGIAIARILRRQKEGEIALRKAREEGRTRENFMNSLINAIPDFIWLKDRDGIYLSCNARFAETHGVALDRIMGATDYDLFPDDLARDFIDYDRDVLEKGKTVKYITDNSRISEKHQEFIETIKAPMYDESGMIIGVLGIGRDITERMILQNQLVQAQKMESVGRLAGGVAHDFNNMISVILGESDLMLDELPRENHLREYVQEIQNAAQRSANLTRQLLTFARKQTISPRFINVNDTIGSILKMLRRLIGENIELEWKPGGDLWSIKADPVQIDQILANLCVNAGDAISGVGKVTISTDNISFDADYCREYDDIRPGDYVAVHVSDTGHGMDRNTRDHIFEPFYTTKETGKGTGLGLATVYGIIKQHQGSVHVYSEPGRGSVFKLYFPRAEDDGTVEGHGDAAKRDSFFMGHETIMLVEDEAAMMSVVRKQLEKLGYRVLPFLSAGEAVSQSVKAGKIDLLITDVIMPEMNGKMVYEEILRSHPEMECLFISGYTGDIISQQGILEEEINLLSKPFTRRSLSEKIREILDGKRD